MVDVVEREEFEQAMAALGLVKVCDVCLERVTEGDPHYGSACRGYGSSPSFKWEPEATEWEKW